MLSINVPASPESAQRYYAPKTVGYLINQAHLFRGLASKGYPLTPTNRVRYAALQSEMALRRASGELRDRPPKVRDEEPRSTFYENNRLVPGFQQRATLITGKGFRNGELRPKKKKKNRR